MKLDGVKMSVNEVEVGHEEMELSISCVLQNSAYVCDRVTFREVISRYCHKVTLPLLKYKGCVC